MKRIYDHLFCFFRCFHTFAGADGGIGSCHNEQEVD